MLLISYLEFICFLVFESVVWYCDLGFRIYKAAVLAQGLKKRELLKEVVLPAMASNRAIQRLLNEFVDLVTECDAAQKASEPEGPIL